MPDLPPLNCGGCRKCCLGDTIILQPQDNPSSYRTRLRADGRRELKRDKAGNCVYLGKNGCQIHGKAPVVCRVFDCRAYALVVAKMTPEMQAARADRASVLEGRARLRALGVEA